jgi:hypothetical protein
VQLRTDKNSLGPDKKKLDVDIIFWNDYDPNNGLRQHAIWDWYGASIKMLFSMKKQAGLFSALMDICDVHEGRKAGTVWSNVLGVPSSDPQSPREVGQLLENRPELLVQLYPLLGVRERLPFEPGKDYLERMDEATDISKIREATLSNVNLLEDSRKVGVSYFNPQGADASEEDEDSFDPATDA